jgi:peroxiredoxin
MIYASWILISLIAADDSKSLADDPSPEQRYQMLVERYEQDYQALLKASEAAKTPEEIKALAPLQERISPKVYVPGFLALADECPGSTVAEDALIWLCAHTPFYLKEGDEAVRRLTRDHARSAKLGPALAFQGRMPSFFDSTEALFRRVLAENTHREICGLASYWLARHLLYKARYVTAARQRPDFGSSNGADPYAEVLGEGWPDRLRRLDADALESEANELLARVTRFYADVPHNDPKSRPGTLGEAANSYLREIHQLAVGKPAPEIEGIDLDGRPFRLSDYRGKIVVLDFGSHFYCGACRQMYPRLRELTAQNQQRPFAVVSINAEPEKNSEELKAAWTAEGNTWRCLFDGTWEGPIQETWNVRRFPTIYVVDAEGRIRHRDLDLSGRDLEKAVDSLVNELPAK